MEIPDNMPIQGTMTELAQSNGRFGVQLVAFTFLGVLVMAGVCLAQQTEVLVDNEQIKVEATTYPEICSTGQEASDSGSTNPTCIELAITNNSRVPITSWVATTEREAPGPSRKVVGRGIHAEDSVLISVLLLENPNYFEILSLDTHRVQMGNPTRVDFKAAIFEDGTVFGEPEWVNRIVQNRRQVYQDVAEALQKLRAAKQAGTPRGQVIQEFHELESKERAEELERLRSLPASERVRLPRLGIFGMVAMNLAPKQTTESGALNEDLNRQESMLLGLAQRLLVSRPPITDHPVPLP
jgi:hypothetical protein